MALTGIVVIFINRYLIANIIGGFEIEIGRGVYVMYLLESFSVINQNMQNTGHTYYPKPKNYFYNISFYHR